MELENEAKDSNEIEGASVGALGHIYKKTFKELYTVIDETAQDDEQQLINDATLKGKGNATLDERSDAPGENGSSSDDALSTTEADLEGEFRKPLISLQDQVKLELAEITRYLKEKETHATEVSEFLNVIHKHAEDLDRKSAKELYEQGLVVQAEYPMGPSTLSIPEDKLASFGSYGAHLILAEKLMKENELLDRYKRGQVESRGLDKAYQIRPSTPNYLKSTRAQQVRLEIAEKSRPTRPTSNKKQNAKMKQQQHGKSLKNDSAPLDDHDVLERRLGESPKEKFVKKPKVVSRKKKETLTTEQILANEKVLNRMKTQLDFLRNPRYAGGNKKAKLESLPNLLVQGLENMVPEQPPKIEESTSFYVQNGKVTFTDYRIGGLYETTVKLHNVSNISRRVRVLPPTTRFFSISLISYPSGSGTVAPGMACVITVKFSPESLADYQDFITVLSENHNRFRVPIEAFREPPSLSIPPELDCGCCLGGNRKSVIFHCANQGGPGRFRLLPTSEWPNPSSSSYHFRSVDIPPFRITPSEFSLNNGDSIEIKVDFTPQGTGWGELEQSFVMVCDNCQVKFFKVKGTSCQVTIEIAALGKTLIDLTTPHMKQPESLSFNQVTVGKMFQRMVRIKNTTPISLKFHWAIYEESYGGPQAEKRNNAKRKLIPIHLLPNAKDIFEVHPLQGSFSANGSVEFNVSFQPRKAVQYNQIAKLVIEDIPPTSVDGFVMKPRRKDKKKLQRGSVDNDGDIVLDESNNNVGTDTEDVSRRMSGSSRALLRPTNTSSRSLLTKSLVPAMGRSRRNIFDPIPIPTRGQQPESNNTIQGTSGDSTARSESESQQSSSRTGKTERTGITEQDDVLEVKLMNIPCLKLGLCGTGEHPLMDIQPRFIEYPGTLLIHKEYTESVTLYNKSEAQFSFDWGSAKLLEHHLPQSDGREVAELSGPLFTVTTSCSSGTLFPGDQIVIEIELKVHQLGFIDLLLPCSYTNGPEKGLCVRIQAQIAGPVVELCSPEIDFGLVAVNEHTEIWLPFKNLSEVPAEYCFEENCQIDLFDTEVPADPLVSPPMSPSNALVPCSPSGNRSTMMSSRSLVSAFTVPDVAQEWCELSFSPSPSGILGPLQRQNIRVRCSAGANPERLRKFLVCKVLNGESQYINVRGEIQSPKVHIDTHGFELGTTYVTVPVVRMITLTNLSNLQAPFKWGEIGDSREAYTVTFEPAQGVLGAKSVQKVKATFVSHKPGRVSSLFACDVEGIKRPLGFFIKTVSRGLVVTYSLVGPDVNELDMYPTQPNDGDVATAVTSTKIPILDFGSNVPLCSRQRVRLCLQNHSAIPTSYEVFIKDFAAKCLPLSLGGTASTACSSTRGISRGSGDSDTLSTGKRNTQTGCYNGNNQESGPSSAAANVLGEIAPTDKSGAGGDGDTGNDDDMLLGIGNKIVLDDSHEVTDIFKSKAGMEFMSKKIQHREDRQVLGRNQGVAFLALKPKGMLAPWKAVIIDIVCFNNLPGRYKDELVCNVVGVSQSRVPVKVRVEGCPLTLSRNTVGLNLNSLKCPQLDYGDIVRSTETVHKVIKVVNSGPMDAHVAWRIEADRSPDADVVQLSLELNKSIPVKGMTVDDFEFVKVSIKLHEELTNVPPFQVQPYQQRVRAFGEAKFRVSYAVSDSENVHKAVMVANGDWLSSDLRMSASTPAVMTNTSHNGNHTHAEQPSETMLTGTHSSTHTQGVLSQGTEVSGGMQPQALSTRDGETKAQSSFASSVSNESTTKTTANETTTLSRQPSAVDSPSGSHNTLVVPPGSESNSALQVSSESTHIQSAATMPNPRLDNSVTIQGRDSSREPMKNCLRLGLSASSIVPKLTLDCPFREDGLQYVNYTVWSTTKRTDDAFFKTLTLINKEGAWLMCAFVVESPGFEIYRIESNAERPNQSDPNLAKLLSGMNEAGEGTLTTRKNAQKGKRKKRPTNNTFNLAPGTSVTVTIRFCPSKYQTHALDANQQIIQSENGALSIKFVNGEEQRLCLEGVILQPMLIADPSLLEFGPVHVDTFSRSTIHLTNHTAIPVQWKVEHVQKSEDGLFDDPTCWEFSPSSGKLPGYVLPISCALACPPQGFDANGKRQVLAVTINFTPNCRGRFQSRYRLSVDDGRSVEVLLRGYGSYEEEHDMMVTRLPVPPVSGTVRDVSIDDASSEQVKLSQRGGRTKLR